MLTEEQIASIRKIAPSLRHIDVRWPDECSECQRVVPEGWDAWWKPGGYLLCVSCAITAGIWDGKR